MRFRRNPLFFGTCGITVWRLTILGTFFFSPFPVEYRKRGVVGVGEGGEIGGSWICVRGKVVCGREEGWEGEEVVMGLIVGWRAGDGSWGERWL